MNLKEYSEKVAMARHFLDKADDVSTRLGDMALRASVANLVSALEILEEALLHQ